MKILTDHDSIVSQPLDYRSNKSVTLEQNIIDLMFQRKTLKFCSVDNTKSSNLELSLEQPIAMSVELLSHQALIVAHIVVSMNFNKR
jgi:hypothetical protein